MQHTHSHELTSDVLCGWSSGGGECKGIGFWFGLSIILVSDQHFCIPYHRQSVIWAQMLHEKVGEQRWAKSFNECWSLKINKRDSIFIIERTFRLFDLLSLGSVGTRDSGREIESTKHVAVQCCDLYHVTSNWKHKNSADVAKQYGKRSRLPMFTMADSWLDPARFTVQYIGCGI